jgi:hypothetical protein
VHLLPLSPRISGVLDCGHSNNNCCDCYHAIGYRERKKPSETGPRLRSSVRRSPLEGFAGLFLVFVGLG